MLKMWEGGEDADEEDVLSLLWYSITKMVTMVKMMMPVRPRH